MTEIRESVTDRITHDLQDLLGTHMDVECRNAYAGEVEIAVSNCWAIECERHVESSAGLQDYGTRYSDQQNALVAVEVLEKQIIEGTWDKYANLLFEKISNSPIADLIWTPSIQMGAERDICNWVERCRKCSGRGDVICYGCSGLGRVNCSQCYGSGYQNCTSCGGLGRIPSGRHYVTCGACSGSKQIRCQRYCNLGKVTCAGCNGQGTLPCRTCDATGWFTHVLTIIVYGIGKCELEWINAEHPENFQQWTGDYLRDALGGGFQWAKLQNTVRVFPDTRQIENRRVVHCFYRTRVQALLPAVSGEVTACGSNAQCHIVGDSWNTISLGLIGDSYCERLSKRVGEVQKKPGELGKLLSTPFFKNDILPIRNHADALVGNTYPVQVGLFSEGIGNALLSAYRTVLESFKSSREIVPLGRLLNIFSRWMLVSWVFLVAVNSSYFDAIEWDTVGFLALPETARMIQLMWHGLLNLDGSSYVLFAIIGGIAYLFYLVFFATRRTMTFGRFLRDFVICAHAGMVLLLSFGTIVSDVGSQPRPYWPGLNEIVASAALSLVVLPEMIVLCLFAALFRLRAGLDRSIRKTLANVDCGSLFEDLEYRR